MKPKLKYENILQLIDYIVLNIGDNAFNISVNMLILNQVLQISYHKHHVYKTS